MFQKLNFPDFSIDVESLVAEVRNFNGHFSVVHVFGWQSKKVFTKIRKIDLFIPSCIFQKFHSGISPKPEKWLKIVVQALFLIFNKRVGKNEKLKSPTWNLRFWKKFPENPQSQAPKVCLYGLNFPTAAKLSNFSQNVPKPQTFQLLVFPTALSDYT